MELRDADLVLRSWTFDDVPAIAEACRDEEIAPLDPVRPGALHAARRRRVRGGMPRGR
jgi:hypothetical protein